MRRAALLLPAILILTACGGQDEDAPTAGEVASSAYATSSLAADDVDRTTDMQAAAGSAVTSALETEPGRIEVETSIVDPRGDAGSDAAQQAIAVCQSAQQLGYTAVSVREADGTIFVVLGANFGDGVTCTEA